MGTMYWRICGDLPEIEPEEQHPLLIDLNLDQNISGLEKPICWRWIIRGS